MTAKTLVCFDFGMRKIGVAIGQTITKTARPLSNLPAKQGIPQWETITQLIQTWQIDAFVVGLPYDLDGSEQPITRAARKFGSRLAAHYQLPVHFVDERLTTRAAQSDLRARGDRKIEVDSYAAQLILESWLREQSDEPI